ncbi:MAG: c-type cytochrome domain-containing protein, partial [Pirellula sp.]
MSCVFVGYQRKYTPFPLPAKAAYPPMNALFRCKFNILCMASALAATALFSSGFLNAQTDGVAFFESKIRPVLVQHCYECHSHTANELAGGLGLDTKLGVQIGGDSGPIVDRSDWKKSLILKAVRYQDLKMPPSKKLPDEVIASFEKWVAIGAPDPRDDATSTDKSGMPKETESIDWEQARRFWSFRP